jgi:hypothetical protein
VTVNNVLLEVRDGVAQVTLNRPDRRNPISEPAIPRIAAGTCRPSSGRLPAGSPARARRDLTRTSSGITAGKPAIGGGWVTS